MAKSGQLEFRIPIHLEDLELSKDDRFCVKNIADLKSLGSSGHNNLLDGEYKKQETVSS